MVIPIRGQYEQLCNSVALKEMGVFVGSGIGDISNFISNGYQIEYKWEDPINKIISIIKS
jgi:hypothetical protein